MSIIVWSAPVGSGMTYVEARRRKPQARSQKSEVRSQKSDADFWLLTWSQKLEVGRLTSDL